MNFIYRNIWRYWRLIQWDRVYCLFRWDILWCDRVICPCWRMFTWLLLRLR